MERFSSDGDGASFPHQRWGFWALVSAKPKDVEEQPVRLMGGSFAHKPKKDEKGRLVPFKSFFGMRNDKGKPVVNFFVARSPIH